MSPRDTVESLATAIFAGGEPDVDLDQLADDERRRLIERLMDATAGRRWLRGSPLLDAELAGRLLGIAEDVRGRRRDATLDAAIAAATLDDLLRYAESIAAGAGAPAFWSRLACDRELLIDTARRIAASGDAEAVEATATHLLLDPVDAYGLGTARQAQIARELLGSASAVARGIAAEHLARVDPRELAGRIEELARDPSARVRGFAWLAAFRVDRRLAAEQAFDFLADETMPEEQRHSALSAAGEALPTAQVVELLAYFVVHPSERLAREAAEQLHRNHRHPDIAIAAAGSPHPEVREIATRLMDPYRGSPAAGGSRPGDPTREDPLLRLMRELEERENETER
ncbi:MAG TPA: hypothetical protein VKZ96_07675 [Thermomicrobiales bacterium]|nr:hypothetical protein [Thermomicrobiales bacterium]